MIDTETRIDDLITKLRARGNRVTPQRIAILEVLIGSKNHPTVEKIYERVRVDFPTTSLSTVYKTVNLLKEMDEVVELGFGDDSSHYDGRTPDPHPHLICVHCHKIVDLELDALGDLPQQVAERTGYDIVSHRLDFYGICPKCQASHRETNPSHKTGG
ncbi:MAG: Fur family transcriptional regulator [Anaerolineae bacterium]